MQCEGLSPDAITFACILKAYGRLGAEDKGKELHANIAKEGLLKESILLNTALVDMYVKCGAFAKAKDVFDELQVRDVVSWNALLTAYAQQGCYGEVLDCFGCMQCDGLSPSIVSLLCSLKACGNIGAIHKGREIYAYISKGGWMGQSISIGTALMDMYANCGEIVEVQDVFDELQSRDVVSWTVLIGAYVEHGHAKEALDCFEHMEQEGLSPDAVAFTNILKACSSIEAADKGNEIHAEIVRRGLLEKHTWVSNALLDMYAKFGALDKAQDVFLDVQVRDIGSWNALIGGYAQYGHIDKALKYYRQMRREALLPDEITFVSILKACGNAGAVNDGTAIHFEIIKEGLLNEGALIGNALVCMYAKCCKLNKAEVVFDELQVRDIVSWTTLIGGYAEHGSVEKALDCSEHMRQEGVSLNALTYACILKVCGCAGAINKGKEIHEEIVKERWLEKDILVGNALVDMYAKCGALELAHEVFSELRVRSVITWTGLITGYSQFGEGDIVLKLFNQMIQQGIEPNAITFTVALNVCNHSGLLENAQVYFDTMTREYGISPTLEHYTCMVDLFSRAGHFNKAVALVKRMPVFDHPALWTALLSACRKWENVELAKFAYKYMIQLDIEESAAYVSMSNIYAAVFSKEDIDKIDALRTRKQA